MVDLLPAGTKIPERRIAILVSFINKMNRCNPSNSCKCHRHIAGLILALLFIIPGLLISTLQADPVRGRALYSNHCQSCHTEAIHYRKKSKVKDYDDLVAWIIAWSTHAGLYWGTSEYEDVAEHMNRTYYRFPVPSE